MYLKKLTLINYRNYCHAELEFLPGINIFFGDNAQGKSNLLESIYLLGRGKSYRTVNDESLIRWGEDFFQIRAEISNYNQSLVEEVFFSLHQRRSVRVNRERISSLRRLPQIFPLVLFSPDDLQLIKGGPQARRGYLDELLGVVFPEYYDATLRYRRALLQRNNLLRRGSGAVLEQAEPWERLLSYQGARIVAHRLYLLPHLAASIRSHFGAIFGSDEPLEVSYCSSVPPDWQTSLSGASELEYYLREVVSQVEERLAGALIASRRGDRQRGSTSVGPHRDDLVFRLQGKEIRYYASQGQQRAAALALRLAQLEILDRWLRERPILLMDDVFSELDEGHRRALMDSLDLRRQVFLTATSLDLIPNWGGLRGSARCWRVKVGCLVPEDE